MIRIMKYGETPNTEIFARTMPTVNVTNTVAEIIRNVRERGDKALREYTKKFDKASVRSLTVTKKEMEEGLRKVEQYKHDLVCSGNYKPAQKILQFIKYIEMPVADLPAAAGTGNILDDSEHCEMISFPEDRVNPRADIGIRISGDSMEPVYHDGQIVWVEKCEELHTGETGIFLYDGKAYIKVYGEQEPDYDVREYYTDSYGTVRNQPVLFSYNSEKYDPIVISPYAPFSVYGRVLG